MDEQTWKRIKKLWNADLNPPIIYDTRKEAKPHLGDEIAAFDCEEISIMVSKPKVEEYVGLENMDMIVAHEVGHYAMIPYDWSTYLTLINEADKVIKNVESAEHVANLFSDAILNTYIFNHDKKIVEMYKKMAEDSESQPEDWQLYVRSYEKLWNLADGTLISSVSMSCHAW